MKKHKESEKLIFDSKLSNEVQIVEMEEENYELFQKNLKLYKNFDPKKIIGNKLINPKENPVSFELKKFKGMFGLYNSYVG